MGRETANTRDEASGMQKNTTEMGGTCQLRLPRSGLGLTSERCASLLRKQHMRNYGTSYFFLFFYFLMKTGAIKSLDHVLRDLQNKNWRIGFVSKKSGG